jgi:flagellar motor protein MotB
MDIALSDKARREGILSLEEDMVTLLLCFFAIMFNPNDMTEETMQYIR